jgi:hypothetical protein
VLDDGLGGSVNDTGVELIGVPISAAVARVPPVIKYNVTPLGNELEIVTVTMVFAGRLDEFTISNTFNNVTDDEPVTVLIFTVVWDVPLVAGIYVPTVE